MAASVETAFGVSGPLLAIPLALISLIGIGLLLVADQGNTERYRSTFAYAIPNVVAYAVIIAASYLAMIAVVMAVRYGRVVKV